MYSKELETILEKMKPGQFKGEFNVEIRRERLEGICKLVHVAPDVECRPVQVGEFQGEIITAPGTADEKLILYLHGGSYLYGSLNTHRELVSRISRVAGMPVLLIDYRLAPEHPFPAAVEDAVAAYRWILAQGFDPKKLALAGESAGGGLTLAALAALRDSGQPLPAAAACLSPWADLSTTAEELADRAKKDIIGSPKGLNHEAGLYLNGVDPRHPLASPVYAELHDFPPLLIQVGADEMLLSDSTGVADNARKAGVKVDLEIWEGVFHGWQAFAAFMPEGQRAIEHIGQFVRRHTGG